MASEDAQRCCPGSPSSGGGGGGTEWPPGPPSPIWEKRGGLEGAVWTPLISNLTVSMKESYIVSERDQGS